jgi:uncharacterized protein YndB with AHSA1/START domain
MANIRSSISIDAPRERVFPLVASATGFSQWWAADACEDFSTGVVELAFFKRTTVYRLKPIQSSTSWTTEWLCLTGQEWTGTRLLFELTETSGKTQLSFTHTDWKSKTDYFDSCTRVWEELMLRLKAVAEGEAIGPLFPRDGKTS